MRPDNIIPIIPNLEKQHKHDITREKLNKQIQEFLRKGNKIPPPIYGRDQYRNITPHAKNQIWAEFGVSRGASAHRLANLLQPTGRLYLFDSWQGLPEDWDLGDGHIDKKGSYQCNKWGTDDRRFIFCDGWFKDSLPFTFPEQLGLVQIEED